jgi:hypothetical protein
MDTLTKDQAIKRIKDIKQGNQVDHLSCGGVFILDHTVRAVISELMAIFDIKEEEL